MSRETYSWILVNNTAIRTEDVRRVELDVVSGFGVFYNITMADGKVLRVRAGNPGADWCCLIMKKARAGSAAAEEALSVATYVEEKTRGRHDEGPESDADSGPESA
jgi:hypothetical protein